MNKRMTERRLIWRVLCEARENLDGFIDAYSHMPNDKHAVEARELVKQIDKFATKYYGRTVTSARNAPFKNAKTVSICELQAILKCEKEDPEV